MKNRISISFYLQQTSNNQQPNPVIYHYILISVFWNGNQRVRTSLGINVENMNWWIQEKNWQGFDTRKYKKAKEVNRVLESLKNEINDFYFNKIAINQQPTIKEIKKIIDDFKNPEKQNLIIANKSLFDYYDEFVEDKRNSGLTKVTIKSYNPTKSKLLDFEKSKKLMDKSLKLTFDSFDDKFYKEFVQFCSDDSDNTTGKHIKIIKVFLKWSADKDYHKNYSYLKFKAIKRNIDSIALTEDDLNKIENAKLESYKLKKVRDLFLLECYTGLRVSDLMLLNKSKVDLNDNVINVYTQKDQDYVTIPIHKKIRPIIDKYLEIGFPTISPQKYNEYIRELCKEAKLNELREKVKYQGGRKKDGELQPVHELVSSHTARRTFITLTLKKGLSKGLLPEQLMKITGHTDRISFQKYIDAAKNESVEKVRSIWDED